MGNLRDTQTTVEVLDVGAPKARATQVTVEVLSNNPDVVGGFLVTQDTVEVANFSSIPNGRATQVSLEVLHYGQSTVPAPPVLFMNTLVAMPLRGSAQGHFSRITTLPGNGQISDLKEVQLISNRTYGVLALTGDGSVYQLFGGTQDGTVTATAITQPLPTKTDIEKELWQTDKVFQELYLEGTDLTNFVITASNDGGVTFPFGPFGVLAGQNWINLGAIEAKQLVLKFVHSLSTTLTPALAAWSLKYDILGDRP